MGVLHDQHRPVAHADDQVGEQHVAAAGQEGIRDFPGGQSPDDAGQDPAEQEQSGHFIDVEVEL